MVFKRTKRFARSALTLPFRSGRYAYRSAKGFNNAMATATAAYYGVQKLRGLVNSEMNKVDFGAAATPDNTTSQNCIHLTAVGVGDGDTQRTGNSIYVRALNGMLTFERNSASTNTATYVRMMLIQDTQQIGDGTPQVQHVLQSDWESHLNTTTVGRFKVLKSKVIVLNSQYPTSSIKFNKAMRHHVRYNGNTTSDIQRGGLYLLLISSEAAGSQPTVRYNIRLSYHDN